MTISVALAILFWGALALLIYAYFVYPSLMVAISRGKKVETTIDNVLDRAPLPSVAVLVAAFNEQKHITARIENLLQQDYPLDRFQVLVGSDGSSDQTVEMARRISDARVTVLDFEINRGKSSVLNDLVAHVKSDILVFTDANTVFKQDTVQQLVAALGENIGAVCGDLVLEEQRHGSNQDHRYWNFERRLKAAESSLGGLVGANGGVYAIRREYYQPLRPDTICDDFVISMNIAVEGKGLKYAPAAVAYEDTPTDVVAEFHRRARIGIGNYQALFRHPNYLLRGSLTLSFTYFSHKVLRWLTPHLLILILMCGFLLIGDPLFLWLTVLQLASYAAATLVFLSRDRVAWPSAVRAALLFAVLNAAFLVGFKRYLTADYRGGWRRTDRA